LENMDEQESNGGESDLSNQVLRPIWNEMREEMMTRLDEITIEDLCRQATGLDIARISETKLDYTI